MFFVGSGGDGGPGLRCIVDCTRCDPHRSDRGVYGSWHRRSNRARRDHLSDTDPIHRRRLGDGHGTFWPNHRSAHRRSIARRRLDGRSDHDRHRLWRTDWSGLRRLVQRVALSEVGSPPARPRRRRPFPFDALPRGQELQAGDFRPSAPCAQQSGRRANRRVPLELRQAAGCGSGSERCSSLAPNRATRAPPRACRSACLRWSSP